jgi:hypothetical protein
MSKPMTGASPSLLMMEHIQLFSLALKRCAWATHTTAHCTHEAGIQCLKLHTFLKTNQDILLLQTQSLERLYDSFGMDIDPTEHNDIPLDGAIDLSWWQSRNGVRSQ